MIVSARLRLPLTRSVFGRPVIAATLVALAGVLLLFGATRWTITSATTRALTETVDTDLAGLADVAASAGRAQLIARIEDRALLIGRESRRARYMLADGKGRRIAGNIGQWPGLSPALSENGYVTLADGTPVYARATLLDRDLRLLVAREYGQDIALLRRLDLLFLLIGGSIILFVALSGRMAAGGLARRVERINRALRTTDEQAIATDLVDSRGDEITELAQHSARSLARISRAMVDYRNVSDRVAHEMRTPLMHLDNRLRMIISQGGDAGTSAGLGKARDDIRSITNMLDSLLDIAASEARAGDPRGLEQVDLSAMMHDLAELYAGSIEEAGLAFTLDIAPGIFMNAEPMQMTRLVSNLLDNAIKYGRETITLRLALGPVIEVIDEGPGIAQEAQATIFDRFQRGGMHGAGAKVGANGGQGHGLGLALARAIAERHGLTLRLAPAAVGAHFIIEPGAGTWG
jgi:signal transduction histidine kinase